MRIGLVRSYFSYYFHYLIISRLLCLAQHHETSRILLFRSRFVCAQLCFESVILFDGSVNVDCSHVCLDETFNTKTQLYEYDDDDDDGGDENNNKNKTHQIQRQRRRQRQRYRAFGSQLFCLCMSSPFQFRFTFTRDHMLFACIIFRAMK